MIGLGFVEVLCLLVVLKLYGVLQGLGIGALLHNYTGTTKARYSYIFRPIYDLLLGGSWVVISGDISPLIWVIRTVTLLITLLITTLNPNP